MLHTYLHMIRSKQKGFTIVELLIVIVVIGILAAIVIVAFNGIQNRANNTTVESNLNNVVKRFEMFRATNDRYPSTSADFTTLRTEGFKLKTTQSNTVLYCIDTAAPDYFLLVAVGYPNNKYKWTSDGVREANSNVAFGSALPSCQTNIPGSSTVIGVWANTFANLD